MSNSIQPSLRDSFYFPSRRMPAWEQMDLSQVIFALNQSDDPTRMLKNLLPFLVVHKQFGCSDLREAILLLEPSLHNKEALRQAALYLFLPDEEEISFEQAQNGLWFAAYTGDLSIAEDAFLCGAKVNVPLYPGMTALLLACKRGHSDLVDLLLHRGADVKFVGGTHRHQTPLSEALFRSGFNRRCLQRLERLDGGFSREWHAKKRIVHAFSLSGFSSLEGYRPRYVLQHYLSKSRAFYAMFKEQLLAAGGLFEKIPTSLSDKLQDPALRHRLCAAMDVAQEAFAHCYHTLSHPNPAEIAERLDQGMPVLCFGITRTGERWLTDRPNSHAWGLVITKDPSSEHFLVQKCDRAGGVSFSGIQILKMNRQEVDQLLGLYRKATDWKTDFLNQGAIFAAQIGQQFKRSSIESIEETSQTIGNCCYYTLQSMELALLYGLLLRFFSNEDTIVLSNWIKSERTTWMRQEELEQFIDEHVVPTMDAHSALNPNSELIVPLVAKIKNKPRLNPFQTSIRSRVLNLDQLLEEYAIQAIWNKVRICIPRRPGDPSYRAPVAPHNAPVREIRDCLAPSPRFIEQITHLDYDTLSGLTVPFPSIISSFAYLKELRLRCSLTSLPPLRLPHLERLDLSKNALTAISTLELPQLTYLDLSENQLRTLPTGLYLGALTTLLLNQNRLIAMPKDLYAPELKKLRIAENQLQAIPLLHFPRLDRSSADRSDLIASFFTACDPDARVPSEEAINFILIVFRSITNPRVQIQTLVNLYPSKNISEEILQKLYSTIAFDKLDEAFSLLFDSADQVEEKKADFIQSLFQFKHSADALPFPTPNPEQIELLLTLFRTITGTPHLLDIMVRVMTAPNSNLSLARSFYVLLPNQIQSAIQRTLLKDRSVDDLYIPELVPSEGNIGLRLMRLYYQIWNELT